MVFSRSSSQDVKSRAKAGAAVAQSRAYQAKAAAVRAQELARQAATTQVAPLARSAQEKAGRGLLEARAWTAPRVEAGGVAVQERLAPAVTAAMVTAARRIDPPKAKRRRWPVIVAGVVVLGVGCAAAAQVLRSRRNAASMAASDPATPPSMPPATPAERQEMTDTAHADVNGQVRTP
jgi:urease accessory protein UreF